MAKEIRSFTSKTKPFVVYAPFLYQSTNRFIISSQSILPISFILVNVASVILLSSASREG